MNDDTLLPEPEVIPDNGEPSSAKHLAVASEILPVSLHILPVHERPFLPVHAIPLILDEKTWLDTVVAVGKTPSRTVGLMLTKATAEQPPDPEALYGIGTAVRMHEPTRRNGEIHFVAEGLQRFRIIKWLSNCPPYLATVEYLSDETQEDNPEVKAYAMAIIGIIKELVPLNPLYNEQLKLFLDRFTPNKPASLAYFAASLTTASSEELQNILQTESLLERMDLVLVLIRKEMEVAKLQARISKQVEEAMNDQQRKFFLHEQLKVIQKELGIAKDDRQADVERFRERIETLVLSESAQVKIEEELEKLSVLERGSPEYAVTRNYLDWMTTLPWGIHSKDILDLKRARQRLDEDHHGLDDVKDRIIEFLAVGKLKGGVGGSIILLVGPPGVGKTSIGRSVAESLGREFYRFSLGGMHNEAEIKGHRRTYIGAMPGKVVQALKEVAVANPVIMLDEIDKVGASYHGDPASALLEVLDPEQNEAFLDYYIDVRVDLSNVLFICTANQLDTIPGPLLDRMEIIHLAGYITEEKLAIAKNHLWPQQREKAGLSAAQLKISDAGLRRLIDGYARQAGVRDLDKQLARIVRKAAVQIVNNKNKKVRVSAKNLQDYLGLPFFREDKPQRGVGVVTGLAWTAMGGTTLDIEASRIHTHGCGFRLTGRLGEVMQESAQIAMSYVGANLATFGAEPGFLEQSLIHLHVPEGATPKDGPSAGVTMASALVSLARNEAINRALAMTGELTLTGRVLPVGGIREKVIAARRSHISELILTQANRGDFEQLPEHLKDGLKVHFCGHFRDIFNIIFESD